MSNKIENTNKLISSLKIQVEDETSLRKDLNAILEMFDRLKKIRIKTKNNSLKKKKICLSELREDEVYPYDKFKPDFYGIYLKVPKVSKK